MITVGFNCIVSILLIAILVFFGFSCNKQEQFIINTDSILDQLHEYMNRNKRNILIDNEYRFKKIPESTMKPYKCIPDNHLFETYDYINPKNRDKINVYAKKNLNTKQVRFCDPYTKLDKPKLPEPKRYHEMDNYQTCVHKAIRRCNVPDSFSTRCILNECDLSTYDQCTNNVINQNKCTCKADDLCKLPDKTSVKCMHEMMKTC